MAPAGSLEKMAVAIHYGADAVYLGGSFGLRAPAAFPEEQIEAAVAYAHARGVKVYVTVNILAHNRDFAGLTQHLSLLRQLQVDGLIVSDPGVVMLARRAAPEIPVHLSTQANVTNLESARFWQQQGVSRLNLARELSLAEVKEIRQGTETEIELFVHGAICISYSGRCLLSHYLTGRDSNRGECAHPCRYLYRLEEEKRPGQFFPVEEDERGTYIFNSKDLCLLFRLPELMAAGVDSLKIEGRMKSIYYVGGVVRLYRAALDYWGQQEHAEGVSLPDIFRQELEKLGTRGVTENFFSAPPGRSDMLYESPRLTPKSVPVGVVRQLGPQPLIEVRSMVRRGETLEYLARRGLENIVFVLHEMRDQQGQLLEQANPGNLITMHTKPMLESMELHGLLRRVVS